MNQFKQKMEVIPKNTLSKKLEKQVTIKQQLQLCGISNYLTVINIIIINKV